MTASPAFGADDITPTEPVTISVAKGTISELSVTNPEGAAVAGTLSADKTSWTLAEPLGYGRDLHRDRHRASAPTASPSRSTATYTTVTPGRRDHHHDLAR